MILVSVHEKKGFEEEGCRKKMKARIEAPRGHFKRA